MRLAAILGTFLLPALAAAQTVPVQVLHTFRPSPAGPNGGLVQVPDGSFYGTTATGIIRRSTTGDVTQVAWFESGSAGGGGLGLSDGGLVRASDGALYGTIYNGGAANRGTVFRFDPATGALRTIHDFDSPTEGTNPVGRLVQVGGSLYGVTQSGPGGYVGGGTGTIFHVVVATGAVVTDAMFSDSVHSPSGPLTLGPDGLLYGATIGGGNVGALYRFDPVARTVTKLRAFSGPDGSLPRTLTLGPDGSLYGNASGGGIETAGTLFRYTPSSGLFERVYSLAPSNGLDGSWPGPLLAATDGHFYGVTERASGLDAITGTLFRFRIAGGTFTYETLRVLDRAAAGGVAQTVLTQAADGLIYGYAASGGPSDTGTLFRFDPAGGGPPSNPIAFAVLHTFPYTTTWRPSAPVPASDGFLYGLTSQGGASNRGAIYRLAPATGAVTILGAVPGTPSTSTFNSSLVPGPDGFLYGTSSATTSNIATSILRVNPAAGAASVAVAAVGPPGPLPPFHPTIGVSPGLVRAASGHLYGLRWEGASTFLYRFDPAANTVTDVTLLPGATRLTALGNGDLVSIVQRYNGSLIAYDAWKALVRWSPSAPSTYTEIRLAENVDIGSTIEGADGQLYVGTRVAIVTPNPVAPTMGTAAVRRVNTASGAVSTACTISDPAQADHLSLAPDGSIVGVTPGFARQRLFRCDPATGGVTLSALPPTLERIDAPLVPVGSLLYGAAYRPVGVLPVAAGGGSLFRLAASGALPALDTDGDALPSAWETAYGLDPFDGANGSGPADDPDGDGRTNAQELADGTHPRGFVTRLFAEGASNAFFRTRFDVANADLDHAAIVRARFLTDTGATIATDLAVPPRGHAAIDPATLPGMPAGSYSAILESDATIAVDRTMSWDATGYGSHLETGLTAASTTWYFAEGSTSGDFSLFYLLQNPQTTAVTATVRYLRPFGQAPIDRTYTLPPASRTTIVVDAESSELASTDVSAVVTATAPIVAERAMYVSRPGQPFAAGHESAGVTAPALEWFLAEGATGAFFDLFVLIANPSTTAATVDVEYLRSSGPPLTKTYTVPAQSRLTIWVDDEQLPAGSGQKPLAQGSVSTAVHVTNGVPVIVERAMWWPGPETTPNFWYEAHNSPGATGTAFRWLIGGGEVAGADAADTYVLIANTAERAGTATVLVMGEGPSETQSVALPPKSRTTVNLRQLFGSSFLDGWYGVLVESVSSTGDPVPIVVERATYASPGGVFWSRGGNALAAPLP
jgi:uncharacterized repeat protein (TIGR03803 family)